MSLFAMAFFEDRVEAGRRLARKVAEAGYRDPVVLALPRGGVPIAAEVAREIGAPLDLLLVRKIGTPMQPELALGAVVDGDQPELVINEEVARLARVDTGYIEAEKTRMLTEIERRRKLYLAGRGPVEVAGRTAIIVDDGIATGSTVLAGLRAVKRRGPARTVLAVPVAPLEAVKRLSAEADDIICLFTPADFGAIGYFYRDFSQLSDSDVVEILDRFGPAGGEAPAD